MEARKTCTTTFWIEDSESALRSAFGVNSLMMKERMKLAANLAWTMKRLPAKLHFQTNSPDTNTTITPLQCIKRISTVLEKRTMIHER